MKETVWKRKKLSLLLALFFAATWGVAFAENLKDDNDILALENFSGSVALTNDYVFRGISQTDEDPAIQGSFDYGHPSGFYLGVWASNVDESISKGNVEMDLYIGYARELFEDFSFDISAIYYYYPGGGDGPEPDFIEGHLGLGYTFSDMALTPTLGVGYYYSPDFFGEDGNAHYVNGTLGLTLPYGFNLSGELGYQDVEGDKTTGNGLGKEGGNGFDYTHWRIGLSKEIKGFELDLSYHDTNEEEFLGDIADSRVVFTLSRTF